MASASSSSRQASSPGRGLSSRYRRLDENTGVGAIARGTFGRVYVALDSATGETVAVKRVVLPSNSATSELCWYKALSQARHPNVMHLLDHFVCKGDLGTCLYMVFDFVDTTLWHMWRHRRGLLPIDTCVALVADLVHGIVHLHEHGIMHSDLSMANMLVGPSSSGVLQASSSGSSHGEQLTEPARLYRLRITDLGGALSASGIVLSTDKIISTEYIRAPEIILGESKPTAAVDLWALGVVAMALACGSLVFWRPDGLEPSVPGLLPALDGDGPSDSIPGERTLANQAAVLGGLGEAAFPGCSLLPRWAGVQDLLKPGALRPHPALFWSDSTCVRRPLDSTDPVVGFILSVLVWNPAKRLSAEECKGHAFLEVRSSLRSAASSVVRSVPLTRLQDLVLQSLHTGRCVDFDTVVRSSTDSSSSQAELASSQVVKRARYWCKTYGGSVPPGVAVDASAVNANPLPAPTAVHSSAGSAAPPAEARVLADSGAVSPGSLSCECRGNCGLVSCKARKNKVVRGGSDDLQICVRSCTSGSSFCSFCGCERCGEKSRQRDHGYARFCSGCAKDYKQASSQVTYSNLYGTFRVDAAWPSALKLTARFAWVTNLAPGVETAFFFSFVDEFLQWRGYSSALQIEHPGEVMLLLVMGCVRWPPLVFRALQLRGGFEPRVATAGDWHDYLLRLLMYADGHMWKSMFDLISPGRSRCVYGVVWLAKMLGVIRKAEGGDPHDRIVSLGVSQTRYVLLDKASSQAGIQRVMDHCVAEGFRFAGHLDSNEDVVSFCSAVGRVVDGVVGAQSTLARGYCCLKLLYLQNRVTGEGAWDAVDMRTLAAVLPDENEYLAPLLAWRGADVRRRLGMSPLSVANLACLWGTVPTSRFRCLARASSVQVLNACAAPPADPMAACVEQARERGEALVYIPAPSVWVSALPAES